MRTSDARPPADIKIKIGFSYGYAYGQRRHAYFTQTTEFWSGTHIRLYTALALTCKHGKPGGRRASALRPDTHTHTHTHTAGMHAGQARPLATGRLFRLPRDSVHDLAVSDQKTTPVV